MSPSQGELSHLQRDFCWGLISKVNLGVRSWLAAAWFPQVPNRFPFPTAHSSRSNPSVLALWLSPCCGLPWVHLHTHMSLPRRLPLSPAVSSLSLWTMFAFGEQGLVHLPSQSDREEDGQTRGGHCIHGVSRCPWGEGRGAALLGHGTREAETQHQPHSAPGQGRAWVK